MTPRARPREARLVADLQQRLREAADPRTKAWFENYLKHVISYRGVKTPAVARILAEWRHAHELQRLSEGDQLRLAEMLIRKIHAEDKFAGILYMQKHLLRLLDADTLLCTAEGLFAERAFFDWSTTDWYSTRVLGPLIVRHGQSAAERIAGWRDAVELWQRRSSIVPFRAVVRDEAYHALIQETIAVLVTEKARFIQTGIGWVISDLSKVYPGVAATLVERHFQTLSAEVIRRHTRYLPDHARYRARKRG